jgi:hypothetical protein
MSDTLKYRQRVADFRVRLDEIISGQRTKRRIHIDTTGNQTQRVPSGSDEDRLTLYGQARHHSVARALGLFEIVREHEGLHRRARAVRVQNAGALWQAYQGNETHNACHTCPSLLRLNGQLPTLITRNRGLQRHIVIEFADCMLLPRSINNIDKVVDETVGRESFARAATLVLNEAGANWHDGLELFKEEMRSVFGYVAESLIGGQQFQVADAGQQQALDAFLAYYEGLYLHSASTVQMQNFAAEVHAETGVPVGAVSAPDESES